jgi:hypothetical protein
MNIRREARWAAVGPAVPDGPLESFLCALHRIFPSVTIALDCDTFIQTKEKFHSLSAGPKFTDNRLGR